MTSKERVRAVMQRQRPDRIPAAFEAVGTVTGRLMKEYGFTEYDQLLEKYQIDIVGAGPRYIGPELPVRVDEKGREIHRSFWGYEQTVHVTDLDSYPVTTYFPLSGVETVEEVDAYHWPDPDWFDYSAIRETIDSHPDKAIIIGHEGPFQIVTYLISMEEFFVLMVEEPEVAKRILDKMVEFELEYYRRCFEAGGGKIDVLRPHDDYGTQISMLFSVEMWREFFKENTKKLVDLAHSYGAFYQQHSCGAVEPVIEDLIECGVDALEPLQKVKGLEADNLLRKYGGRITFHGGIDTQDILPHGTPEEVAAETRRFLTTLGQTNGYILMASQGFEGDVPTANIEAVYAADRSVPAGAPAK